MTLYEYLRQEAEDIPLWLAKFRDGDGFSHRDFFNSRVVYYPGSGIDGHPVKVFGSTHSAHCFVYADYIITQDALENELQHPKERFLGYHTLSRLQLRVTDVVPDGWIAHVRPDELRADRYGLVEPEIAAAPFGFLEVLERDATRDDRHGARRLAILFLGADGIATYDALFCQGAGHSVPFAVLLQDHGFGGNYDSFGGGALLERIALRCNVVPRRLLVGEGTRPWQDFERVRYVEGDPGGMWKMNRFLYERQ